MTPDVDGGPQEAQAATGSTGETRADDVAAQQEPDAGAPAGEAPPAAGAAVSADDARSEDELHEEMQGRISELTDDLQRLQAEYLNYKRRVDRDRDLVLQNAKVNVLSSLLPVLDDIDRAREHEELTGGFKAVAEGVERVVAGAGMVRFGAPGDEFDPRLHEALSHSYAAPDDGVTTTTCQYVVQAGYQIGERVVRPAKVVVVDPAPAADEAEAAESQT